MSSFPAQAALVRNVGLPVRRRLLALRECVLHFAPYGFRATWHHLVVHAGLPVWLEQEDDPRSLLYAIDELEDARRLWLAEVRSYTSRRRREKAMGLRCSPRADGWRSWVNWLAFCPDPEVHPAEPLAAVVSRLLAAYRSTATPAQVCPVCEEPRPSAPCPHCGVWSWNPSAYPWNPAGTHPPHPPSTGLPWPLIWHRAVRQATTVGGGDIDQFRIEFTPTSHDRLFGIFQIYIRGVALGDATTTALYPHVCDLQRLYREAERPGVRGPEPLDLGDTFDHLDLTLETTEQDMIFAFTTRPRSQGGAPPPWAPAEGRRMRLLARRLEILRAWRDAEPRLRQFLAEP